MSGNYGWGLPIQASSFAADIDKGIWILHAAMVLIFVLWGIFFTYLLIRYRSKDGARAEREHMSLGASLAPDIAVLTFEIALVAFYAVPVWSRIKMSVPDDKDAVRVEIVAEQFNWNIHYPGADGTFGRRDAALVDFSNPLGLDRADKAAQDDFVAVNEMRLPVGRPVIAQLSSKDVIHSFFIPEFRIKQDATPGLVIPVWFTPTREGHYEITCAQLCGVGHAMMRADVYVDSPADFASWAAASQPAPPQAASKGKTEDDF